MRKTLKLAAVLLLSLAPFVAPAPSRAARIEDLCDVRGVRPNQITGYGLVVGLSGTGDMGQARFTVQSTAAMLRRLGATIDPAAIQTRNAAAVVVTATLPPFANPGTRIDVTVSSLGNARSLAGGTLIQTPLYGADRKVYAVAQGPLIVGGFSASARTGSSVQQNFINVGRVPQGAIVERKVAAPELSNEALFLTLKQPSFVTARRIVAAIEEKLGEGTAQAVDSGLIEVKVTNDFKKSPVSLLAEVQGLEVEPGIRARIIVDERTGTVVLGAGVRIREAAVAQGGLTVEIGERFGVSQPGTFGQGNTAVVPESEVRAELKGGSLHHIKPGAELADVVTALNTLGARPRDLIAILQALHAAGALEAEIETQ